MKGIVSMTVAIFAALVAIVAVISGIIVRPSIVNLEAGSITGNELADNAVTSPKILDGTITLADLSNQVKAEITGIQDIIDGTITNDHIADDADIDPSKIAGTAWTSDNDGYGSGLDADTIDGKNSSEFADAGHSHSGLIINTTVLDVNCPFSGVGFNDTYEKITDIGAFNKIEAGSTMDIAFYGRIGVSGTMTGTNAAFFELRVDDLPTMNGRALASVRYSEIGIYGVQTTIRGMFSDFDPGDHTVSIWVKSSSIGGNGTGATVNPGCYSSDYMIIQELL